MNRLIQGDVGAGKTVVAMGALLMAVDNGYQGALVAPTEILAEQHYVSLKGIFSTEFIDTTVGWGTKIWITSRYTNRH